MEWMSDWIRQIILIIFIATFIDLLLPSSSLDRYVKLVMGLIIIMAILQPILQLVLTDRWKKLSTFHPSIMTNSTYATLDEIRAESGQLSQVRQEEINRRFQAFMNNWLKQQVSEKFHVEVVSSKVITEFKQGDSPVVKQILVVVNQQSKNASIQAVEPIQQIEISNQSSSIEPAKPQDTKLQSAIERYIETMWDLADEQVVVRVHSP